MGRPAIMELDSTTLKDVRILVDAELFTTIKILASLKGDNVSNMINDILRAFADRNRLILENFKKNALETYDKIEW